MFLFRVSNGTRSCRMRCFIFREKVTLSVMFRLPSVYICVIILWCDVVFIVITRGDFNALQFWPLNFHFIDVLDIFFKEKNRYFIKRNSRIHNYVSHIFHFFLRYIGWYHLLDFKTYTNYIKCVLYYFEEDKHFKEPLWTISDSHSEQKNVISHTYFFYMIHVCMMHLPIYHANYYCLYHVNTWLLPRPP